MAKALPAKKTSINDQPIPELVAETPTPATTEATSVTGGLEPDKPRSKPIVRSWEGRLPLMPPPMRLIIKTQRNFDTMTLFEASDTRAWIINDSASARLLRNHRVRWDGPEGAMAHLAYRLLVQFDTDENGISRITDIQYFDSIEEVRAIIGFWFSDHPQYADGYSKVRIEADALYPFWSKGEAIDRIGRWGVEQVRQYFSVITEKRLKFLSQKTHKALSTPRDKQVISGVLSHEYYDAMGIDAS